MKKLYPLFLISIFFVFSLSAQDFKPEPVDYKKIKKEISKKSSDFYYPKLMERYLDGDPSLSIEEKRHLYYGYIYQPGYSGGSSISSEYLRELLNTKDPDDSVLNQIIISCDSILVNDPFNVRALNYQLMSYDALEDQFGYEKVLAKLKVIVHAILSSGDGLKKKSAFYVIAIPEEYFILDVLGYEFGGGQSLIEHYDYLELAKNKDKIKGFYFDITPHLNALGDLFK